VLSAVDLRAHRACGEHTLHVLLDFSTVVSGAGSVDEEVELFGSLAGL
jgi:hypothetical protein